MGLFGEFKDFFFEDVVTVISAKQGRLSIFSVPGFDSLFLDVDFGYVRDFQVNKTANLDEGYLLSALKNVVLSREGSFEFSSLDSEVIDKRLSIPLVTLVLETVRGVDELEAYYDDLPHPETRFILQDGADLHAMAGDDRSYFELGQDLLLKGTNAIELAERSGIPEIHLRYYLYRWNLLGLVQTLRLHKKIGHFGNKGPLIVAPANPVVTNKKSRRVQIPRKGNLGQPVHQQSDSKVKGPFDVTGLNLDDVLDNLAQFIRKS
ncbi:MAG: hypothetical protein AAF558_02205 [Verrucomicrobiota bacterium]